MEYLDKDNQIARFKCDKPTYLLEQTLKYSDDFAFCSNFNGMNIAITGCTGTVGSVLVDCLLRECKPAKVGLFCRDD